MLLFKKDEKDFLLAVWAKVLPQGRTREEIRMSDQFIEAIQKKLDALPVEVPVEPPNDGLDGLSVEGLDGPAKKPRKRKR